MQILARHFSGGKSGNQLFAGQTRRRAVVLAEIADIKIQRYSAQFGPGVNSQVRFGENHGASRARWLAGAAKLMEDLSDRRQSWYRADGHAQRAQGIRIAEQACCAAAFVQIGDEVQSVHSGKQSRRNR